MDKELTRKQQQILNMYIVQGLSVKEIANRRGVSVQSIYKILKKLAEKGYVFRGLKGGFNLRGCTHTQPPLQASTKNQEKTEKVWRYHALEFEVRPYYLTNKYFKILKERGNQAKVYGRWRYVLYYKKMIIWLIKGMDFVDSDKHRAIMKAQDSLNSLLTKLSHRLGFYWDKDNRISVKLLKHHLAYTNAPEKDVVTEKQIKIVYDDTGKIRMLYDYSKGIFEREFVSKRAVDDSDQFDKYILDFLDNDPPTNSQLAGHIMALAKNTDVYVENIKKHLKVLDDMSKTMKAIRRELRGGRFLSRRSKSYSQQQLSLRQFIS